VLARAEPCRSAPIEHSRSHDPRTGPSMSVRRGSQSLSRKRCWWRSSLLWRSSEQLLRGCLEVKKLEEQRGKLHFAYEPARCGYECSRQLIEEGHASGVAFNCAHAETRWQSREEERPARPGHAGSIAASRRVDKSVCPRLRHLARFDPRSRRRRQGHEIGPATLFRVVTATWPPICLYRLEANPPHVAGTSSETSSSSPTP
jgi:hypothetical protein